MADRKMVWLIFISTKITLIYTTCESLEAVEFEDICF